MKKCFAIGKMNAPQLKAVEKPILVAYVSNKKLYVQNLEVQRSGSSPDIEWDESKSEMVLRFQIMEGETLVLGDKQGMAEKRCLDENNTRMQGVKLSSH